MAEYIEREKVLEAINGLRDKEEVFSVAEGALDKAFAAVEEIPAADVRPERHARWSDNMVSYMDDFNGGLHIGFRCSKCKAILNKTTYCGNCGAKMDGDNGEK